MGGGIRRVGGWEWELSQQHKVPFSLQEAMECPTMAHAELSLMKMIC